jgi:hypothetical protein
MASGFSGSEGSISAGGEGERLMGLSIFLVSAIDVGVSTEVSASTGTEGSAGTEVQRVRGVQQTRVRRSVFLEFLKVA